MIQTESDGETVTVCFRLKTSEASKLDKLADDLKRSRANLVNKIVTDYLEGAAA